MVGLFINTIPVRIRLLRQSSLIPWLHEIQTNHAKARQFDYSPLVQVQSWSEIPRGLPLFDSLLVFENYPITGPSPESRAQKIEQGRMLERVNYPLTMMIDPGSELLLKVLYDSGRFHLQAISQMTEHYVRILESIVANADQHLWELPMLSSAEYQRLVREWNETRVVHGAEETIHELFEKQVRRTPAAIAVRSGEVAVSYAEVERRANQLAHYLVEKGVQAEELVGIYMPRGVELVVGVLGILKAGGAYVPLDASYPRARLEYMLRDAGVQLVVTVARAAAELSWAEVELVSIDEAGGVELARRSGERCGSAVRGENLAYVIYTSGSTGQPKGVEVPHRAVVNLLSSVRKQPGLTDRDVLLAVTTLSFDIAALEFFLPLSVGACLALATREESADGELLLEKLHAFEATAMQATPVTWRMLLDAGWNGSSRLKILCGGEALPVELSLELLRRGESLWNLYGPTETTIWSAVYKVGHNGGAVPIGRPIANTQMYLLNANLQPVAIGVPGELYIGGIGVARGYHQRPELSAERFIPDPFSESPGKRMYRTGDLARYRSDGNIEYLGRIDHQVKIRGTRIELGEIETLLEQHDSVREAVVLAREDTPGNKYLAAYLVAERGNSVSTEDLRAFLKQELPEYMTPSAFVFLNAFPLTPNGKIDRKALPQPDHLRSNLNEDFLAPRTQIEEVLAGIWAEVLGLEQVGVRDNFFELGGHSLLVTRVISRVRKVFNVEMSPSVLFEAPTVAALSERITGRRGLEQPLEIVKGPPDGLDLPLSFAQQRLWFLDQLAPGTPLYNIPLPLRLSGPLDAEILQRSLSEIIRRHECLRATFATLEGQPVQNIAPARSIELPFIDLTQLSNDQREEHALELAREDAQLPFDLSAGPLLRASLLHLSENEHILLLCTHHIVFDAWSAGILLQELTLLYQAFSEGKPSPFSELPIQYVDFARWQRQWLQGDVLKDELDYWREQLAGAPAVLELPTDRPRPSVQSYRGATQEFLIPADLSASLKTLSREEGVTLFMTLLAAFQTLLCRYSGQEEVVVGVGIANRDRIEIEQLIGFFVNNLALRTDLSDNPSFRELLGRVREVALNAYAHKDLPFDKLVEALQPERDLTHAPIFQVTFTLLNAPTEFSQIPNLALTPIEINSATAKLDMTLIMTDTPRGLSGSLEYNTDLFDNATIRRMLWHFHNILRSIVANPTQRLSTLPILTEEERRQIVVEWNDTKCDYPRDRCVHELFEEQVEKTPEAVAVIFGDEQISYRSLNRRANQLAHYLQTLGIGPEVRVALCTSRTPEMIIGLLGILKAGAAYVPLDPGYPMERLAFMLQDAGASVLLTQEDLVNSLPVHWGQVICLDRDWEIIEKQNPDNPSSSVSPDNLAYIIYTSGSTGKPKGVLAPHRGLCNLNTSQIRSFNVDSASRVLQFAAYSFDASVSEFGMALLSGGAICLASQEDLLPGPGLIRIMRDYQISNVTFPPSTLARLPEDQLPALRTIIVAGESCTSDLVARWAGGRQFIHGYGPTEVTVCATIAQLDRDSVRLHVGRPMDNKAIYLLDKWLQPVPIGVTGEIYVGGIGVARGYVNRPDLTAEKFTPDPFGGVIGGRLYRTGDLGRYCSDGNLEFVGRSDNQVKIRGFRIELGEVEATLTQHPGVREAVVLARKDQSDDKRLVAYLVSNHTKAPTVSSLRNFLKEKLPEYMVPSAFVVMQELPLSANGKVDRKKLSRVGEVRPTLENAFAEPRDLFEIQLAKIWQGLLEIEPIGIRDNFFELGGHSLLAVRMTAQIQAQFGKDIFLPEFFQRPTIEHLAEVLREESSIKSTSALVPIQPLGSRPPLFCVHPGSGNVLCYVELARRLGQDQPLYGLRDIGLDSEVTHLDTIEEMSRRYIDDMREVQPAGPYLLAGYSFGAFVAFEMAQQLKQQHEEVKLLALFDAGAPAFGNNRFAGADDAYLLSIIGADLARGSEDDSQRLYEVLRDLGSDEQLKYVLRYVMEKTTTDNTMLQDNLLQYIGGQLQVFKNRISIMRNYMPQVYPGQIILFQSEETKQMIKRTADLDPTLGWAELSNESVELQVVPGTHSSITAEPYVEALAERLKVFLNKAQVLTAVS